MVRKTGMAGFVAVTVILILVAAFFCAETVLGSFGRSNRETEEYYMAKERELTDRVREFLDGEGFRDSGVMVTRVVEEDGSREYTVAVHNREIDALEESERENLLSELERLTFIGDRCSFRHQFF